MKKKISRDRKAKYGPDYQKIAKIWTILKDENGWLHIAEISRRTGINQVTVRWYLDHYLANAVESARPAPTIKLRMIRLKPNLKLEDYIKATEAIRETS